MKSSVLTGHLHILPLNSNPGCMLEDAEGMGGQFFFG